MVLVDYRPQKTYQQLTKGDSQTWFEMNAEKEVLGRMATRIAVVLMGKHKPTYTPHVDCGDFVVVTNAAKVRVSGQKVKKKLYYYHTGYLGGLRNNTLEWMIEHKPDQVIRTAVRKMLPKSRLGRKLIRKLKIYPGAEHPHGAQKPSVAGSEDLARGSKAGE